MKFDILTKGTGASVEGVFVHDPGLAHKGGILVLASADPEFTDAALRSAAVAVEAGGRLAHLVIVCREAGVPVIRLEGCRGLLAVGASGRICFEAGQVSMD